MPNDTGIPPLAQTRIDHLERLGDELIRRGLRVRLAVPVGTAPSLHVMNPDSSALTESILAEHGADGWWYWWSWEERIAAAGDIGTVADHVVQALSTAVLPGRVLMRVQGTSPRGRPRPAVPRSGPGCSGEAQGALGDDVALDLTRPGVATSQGDVRGGQAFPLRELHRL